METRVSLSFWMKETLSIIEYRESEIEREGREALSTPRIWL